MVLKSQRYTLQIPRCEQHDKTKFNENTLSGGPLWVRRPEVGKQCSKGRNCIHRKVYCTISEGSSSFSLLGLLTTFTTKTNRSAPVSAVLKAVTFSAQLLWGCSFCRVLTPAASLSGAWMLGSQGWPLAQPLLLTARHASSVDLRIWTQHCCQWVPRTLHVAFSIAASAWHSYALCSCCDTAPLRWSSSTLRLHFISLLDSLFLWRWPPLR
jgi:hypothetical protein